MAVQKNLRSDAVKFLNPRLAAAPEDSCLHLNLGRLEFSLRNDRAESLFLEAARLYGEHGDAEGEARSRINLTDFLRLRGRFSEAQQQLEEARRAAGESGQLDLQDFVLITEAELLEHQGKDLSKALRILRQVEDRACGRDRYKVCRSCLLAIGNVFWSMGLSGEAQEPWNRLAAEAREANDRYMEATALYNSAFGDIESWQGGDREPVLHKLDQALQAAQVSENGSVEARAHLQIGKMSKAEERQPYYQRCVDLAREIELPGVLGECLQGFAAHISGTRPEDARKWLNESYALALETQNPWILIYGSHDRMRAYWSSLSPQEAFAQSLDLFRYIDALRELQVDSGVRASLFSAWTDDYYWLSGRVLESISDPPTSLEVEQAFSVTESLRSRVLLDALETAGATPKVPVEGGLEQERQEVLSRIVGIQRRLLDPELTTDQKAKILGQLEGAESSEAEVNERIAESHPDYTALKSPSFVSLAEVSTSLLADEALLSFQLAPWRDIYGEFAGGSWVLVTTRQRTRFYRLPDRSEVESRITMVHNLMKQRDDRLKTFVALYEELLGDALSDLPGNVERLIIVPDGRLHLLPFGALRASEDGPPLAARFQISAAPSATLWLRWRQGRPAAAAAPALALAGPVLPAVESTEEGSTQRSWLRDNDIELRPLPHAHREAEAVLRHLGKPSVLQRGEEASESFLKNTRLDRFAILHFATHAVVDDSKPGRSFVLLAPGAKDEDGLLQFRDIVDLDLNGQVVVLSTCQSATGTLLRGEGVLSLARAFFQAGAHTVIGSLWPIRDDETADLIDGFYHHLSDGLSVAEAMRQAQLEQIRDGVPVAAWAGLIVLGDGDYVPFPGGRPKPPYALWAVGAVVVIAAAFLVGGYVHRRRTRPWTRSKRLKRA